MDLDLFLRPKVYKILRMAINYFKFESISTSKPKSSKQFYLLGRTLLNAWSIWGSPASRQQLILSYILFHNNFTSTPTSCRCLFKAPMLHLLPTLAFTPYLGWLGLFYPKPGGEEFYWFSLETYYWDDEFSLFAVVAVVA